MKFGNVEQRADLGVAMLVLAALVFGKGNAALGRIARLAEIGRERAQILEGDVRADVDRIRQQKFCAGTAPSSPRA